MFLYRLRIFWVGIGKRHTFDKCPQKAKTTCDFNSPYSSIIPSGGEEGRIFNLNGLADVILIGRMEKKANINTIKINCSKTLHLMYQIKRMSIFRCFFTVLISLESVLERVTHLTNVHKEQGKQATLKCQGPKVFKDSFHCQNDPAGQTFLQRFSLQQEVTH